MALPGNRTHGMTCFYRISRTPEEARKELGEAPRGETLFEDWMLIWELGRAARQVPPA